MCLDVLIQKFIEKLQFCGFLCVTVPTEMEKLWILSSLCFEAEACGGRVRDVD
jgi:hypothetical protein